VDADDGTIDGQVDGEAEFDHSKFDQVIKELDEEIGSEPGSGDEDEGVATTVDDEIVEETSSCRTCGAVLQLCASASCGWTISHRRQTPRSSGCWRS
jgi:hypothetical protein